MTELHTSKIEMQLNKIEKKYCGMMRSSFEVSLNNREKADAIHKKAEKLYHQIIETREELNLV